jgi:hypothetical protein
MIEIFQLAGVFGRENKCKNSNMYHRTQIRNLTWGMERINLGSNGETGGGDGVGWMG